MIRIIAVLCQLAHPDVCHDQLVASDSFQPLTMFDCSNVAALAEWARAFPQYRVRSWRCQIGEKGAGI